MRIHLLVLLAVVAISCSKNRDQVSKSSSQAATAALPNNKIESCNFGFTQFNMTKRAPVDEIYAEPSMTNNGINFETPSAVILLDFNGHEVQSSVWNASAFTTAPGNLQAAEIQKILQRVSEDYAPFQVLVTTNEALYNLANPSRRMRVVVTESWEWYGAAGGIAYYNSFTWGNNTPCFVFSSLLGYNEKYIAEAISHEVGHTFGLRHQANYSANCSLLSENNMGIGSGITGWAPIMGIGYYQNVTTWNKGAILDGCGVIQDDLATIGGVLGFKADYNVDLDKANELVSTETGTITSQTDVDYFFVHSNNAPLTIKATPLCIGDGVGANLHVKLRIYDKKKDLIQTISNPSSLEASITLPKGKYYIGVESADGSNGSKYGLLGRYTLKVI